MIPFSPEELQLLTKIEASIDGMIVKTFSSDKSAGAPIRFSVQQNVEPKIAYAIARRYEAQGWRVSVITAAPLALQFVPEMRAPSAPSPAAAKSLPPVVHITPTVAPASKRLLIRMATRSRPAQALEVLAKYRAMAGVPVIIEVVIDEDDETMLAAPVIQRLVSLDCVITVGKHKNKIDAMNAGRVTEWDIIVAASDDQVPVMEGYGKLIIDEMEKHFPYLDGGIYFNDGQQGANCATTSIMGRRLYEQLGSVIYWPEYKSLFCDAEYTDLARAMGRLAYIPVMPIEHRHPAWGLATLDKQYVKNQNFWDADQALYLARKARNFDAPEMMLTIGILTIPSRKVMFERLLDYLYVQILRDAPRECEILVDSGEGTMGAKRQRILERAKGKFVAFVDDDDWISSQYVSRTIDALKATPDADCASLVGMMTTAGASPERFEHSIKHDGCYTKDGVHYRTPRQINAIRLDHALATGYKDIHYVDDQDFCERVRPLLKVEADTGSEPLYLYFWDPDAAQKVKDHTPQTEAPSP